MYRFGCRDQGVGMRLRMRVQGQGFRASGFSGFRYRDEGFML